MEDTPGDRNCTTSINNILLGIVTAGAFSVILKTNKRLILTSCALCLFVLWQIGLFSHFLNQKIYSDIYEKEYVLCLQLKHCACYMAELNTAL